MMIHIRIYILALILSQIVQPAISINISDREVLELLYGSCNGDKWIKKQNWVDDDISICEWQGIECKQSNNINDAPNEIVERIDLADNNLDGNIPIKFLFQLPQLIYLKLRGNTLEWTRDDQRVVSQVELLDISETGLQNADLDSIFGGVEFPDLTHLYLGMNNLFGPFPEVIFEYKDSLEKLTLDGNNLDGTIPERIGLFRKLVYLCLSNNHFKGEIPSTITKLNNLKYLLLRDNQLTGTIPTNIEDLALLEYLDLARQRDPKSSSSNNVGLSGRLPSFSTLSQLSRLDLSFNSISGRIPFDFLKQVDPTKFDYAFLNSNYIEGSLPETAFLRLPEGTIYLQDNRISSIPTELCQDLEGAVANFGCNAILCKPFTFNEDGRQEKADEACEPCKKSEFYGATSCPEDTNSDPSSPPIVNNFPREVDEIEILRSFFTNSGGGGWTQHDSWMTSASICTWYGITCVSETEESVEYIMLSNNNIKGILPSSLYNLPNLRSLSLSKNDIEITFNGIQNALLLTTLDLQETKLTSLDELEKAPSLIELDLSDNDLTGPIPTNIFALSTLEELKLDGNELIGPLSFDFRKLTKLKTLSANGNSLTGDLPDAFSIMDIQTLRLRSNKFSGAVNQVLDDMSSLVTVDLSHQRDVVGTGFTGAVPKFDNHHHLRRLDLSHNSLTGHIPQTFLLSVDPTHFEYADLSSNSIIGGIPERLNELHDIYLQDNMIDNIPESCVGTTILDMFGCDALLCPPKTYNSILGRKQSYDTKCEECPQALYYGTVSCPPRIYEPDERKILEKLYNTCYGDAWTERTNWMGDADICEWSGIQCNAFGKIEGINLKGNGLIGTPPPDIFHLPSLNTLNLESNNIDFDFDGIENAKNLDTLDLSHTDVESLIGLQKSPSLKNLHLAQTNLREDIPFEIFELTTLVHLSLEFNDFTGTLPSRIGNLINLEYLAIHNNKLNGSLPTEFSQLTNLHTLLAQHNNFTGPFLDNLSTLTELWFLDISDQKKFDGIGITGKLPSFSDSKGLRRLDLNSNSLSGEIPRDLLGSINPNLFEYVDLSNNELTGMVPDFFAEIPIDVLNLANNKITAIDSNLCGSSRDVMTQQFGCDSILCPPEKYNQIGRQNAVSNPCIECKSTDSIYFGSTSCSRTSLPETPELTPIFDTDVNEKLILEQIYNDCGGPKWERKENWMGDPDICTWFGIRCIQTSNDNMSVQHIFLSSNNLEGNLPRNVFLLENLETLVLDNNKVIFDFSYVGNAIRLSTLELSSTGLSSIAGISNAKNLVKLHLTNNNINGPFPDEFFRMSQLEQLNLDTNQLTGAIPDEISNLRNLRLFSCANNELGGTLPESLGELKRVVTLRLQDNMFSGEIPKEIGDMKDLAFIDLSKQKSPASLGFIGSLPDLSQLKDLHRIYLNNNNISGSIPPNFLFNSNAEIVNVVDLSFNRISGNVPLHLAFFEDLRLQGNMISELDLSFCNVAFGCDGFLCKPYSYNSVGYQRTFNQPCEQCSSAEFYGATHCETPQVLSSPSQPPGDAPESKESTRDAPGSNMSEREILELFFKQCRGMHWYSNENWNSKESICNWSGITCVVGEEIVEKIELGANNVQGIPPVELFRLRYLKSLVLYSNPLDGFKFDWIKEAKRLEELILDATGIDSIKGIERAPELSTVKVRFNKIRGNLGDITEMKSLKFLTASSNYLTGTVPGDFDNLENLEVLLLGNNNLEGDLDRVRFPETLKILDLSSNDLTGTIPTNFLTEIHNTAEIAVDLSDNSLTGDIPYSLARFESLTLLLRDNKFTEVASLICTKDNWNGGDIEKYGCKGLLCPKGTSAPEGRETDTHRCTHCKHAKHTGSSICHQGQFDDSSDAIKPNWGEKGILSLALGLILYSVFCQ